MCSHGAEIPDAKLVGCYTFGNVPEHANGSLVQIRNFLTWPGSMSGWPVLTFSQDFILLSVFCLFLFSLMT